LSNDAFLAGGELTMTNTGVRGRVIDDAGQAISDLVLGAYDIGLFGERLLVNTANRNDGTPALRPYARTDDDGNFSITYAGGQHDLVVRVYDGVLRQVGIGSIHRDVSDTTLLLADDELRTARDLVSGYVAKGGEFSQAIDGNEVTSLVDNRGAWKEVIDAVEQAHHTIDWILFYLDIDWVRMDFAPDTAAPSGPTRGRSLEDALRRAGQRGVAVRLACNQLMAGVVPVPWPVTTALSVARAMNGASNVSVRAVPTHFTAPIHTKFVVLDNEVAYVLGSPFVSDYYDDLTHSVDDARRGTFIKPFDSRGIRVPTHDVSLRIRGPAIQQLNKTFLLHWTGANSTQPPTAPAPAGQARIQVTRSLCGNERWAGIPRGETAVLESYLRAINSATTYVYLENQYVTAHEIADALSMRVKQVPDLEVIIVTNNKVDIPDYAKWQPQNLQRLLNSLTPAERKRVGLFTTWSHSAGEHPGGVVIRNYIHSKVAIVDDIWATVGSANLDGASLSASQNASAGKVALATALFPSLRVDGDVGQDRESETNVAVFDGVEGASPTGYVSLLRRGLWAEHLGLLTGGLPDPEAGPLKERPDPGGWLQVWNTTAAAKLASLKSVPAAIIPAKILRFPFSDESLAWPSKADTAAGYLAWAGVPVEHLAIRETFRRFDWASGKWVDPRM